MRGQRRFRTGFPIIRSCYRDDTFGADKGSHSPYADKRKERLSTPQIVDDVAVLAAMGRWSSPTARMTTPTLLSELYEPQQHVDRFRS